MSFSSRAQGRKVRESLRNRAELTFLLVDEDWVASALLFKSLGVWLDSADWLAEGGSIGSVRVRAALQVELAGKIGANWL